MARLPSGCHTNVAEDCRTGRFRADLFYRLAVVTVRVPPLRERTSDIPALIAAFRRRWAVRFDMPDVIIADEVVAALTARAWPGNVRELDNAVAGLLAISDGREVGLAALTDADVAPAPRAPLRARVDAFERTILADTLRDTGGNQSEAARRLGVTRSTLIEKLKRYGL